MNCKRKTKLWRFRAWADSNPQNRGDEGGRGSRSKSALSAATGHVGEPGAAATRMVVPLRKGSVLEAGRERRKWVGDDALGRNCTDPRERWMAGS